MPDWLGTILVLGIVVTFIRSFSWHPVPAQVYDHDKEVGKIVNRLWKVLNKPQ